MSECDGSPAESLSTDQALDLLGSARRRRALAVLRDADGAMRLHDLAEEIAARDAGVTPQDVDEERRERAAVSLHHCHLPKLDDADVVEYDPTTNQVEMSGSIDVLGPYFDVIEGP